MTAHVRFKSSNVIRFNLRGQFTLSSGFYDTIRRSKWAVLPLWILCLPIFLVLSALEFVAMALYLPFYSLWYSFSSKKVQEGTEFVTTVAYITSNVAGHNTVRITTQEVCNLRTSYLKLCDHDVLLPEDSCSSIGLRRDELAAIKAILPRLNEVDPALIKQLFNDTMLLKLPPLNKHQMQPV